MNTLSQSPKTRITKAESYSITHSFVCDAVVPAGVMVKLKSNGEVTPVAAVTDKPLGMVVVGNKAVGTIVTVQTQFSAIMTAEAAGAVARGAELVAAAPASGVQRYATATYEQAVCAIALSAGTNAGDSIEVGILRSFYVKGEEDTTA